SFVLCRDCGFVLKCPNCDISLTLHMDTHTMKCHYCGHEEAIPRNCPNCHSRQIRYYGTGTEKVEEELQDLLPDANIIRMDNDTTRKKGAHAKLLAQFGMGALFADRVNRRPLPKVSIIDMKKEMQQHAESNFSAPLLVALQDRLERHEQSVLMLNRRGYSSFVLCRDCGFVLKCPNCDISLTLHMDTHTMKCHYCGHEEAIPRNCPNCHSRQIRYYGTGTEKVEEELQDLLPDANIIRMDNDTTRKKGAHAKLLAQFGSGEADILIGTQMIAADRVNRRPLPKVSIIDMKKEMQQHAESNFSAPLLVALQDRLERHEQSVLMLNRRGYSSFVLCRDCGFVLKCPNCDISLTLHMDTHTICLLYSSDDADDPR
ncbi:hypothetical protein WP50_24690, partial [Lactiplantibacillus plantarum]